MNQYPNTLFETSEQRAERELYEAQRKAFFESIPKRAEQSLIVGQTSESLVEELRRQLSELGVLRTLDQQRIAALEAELAANTLPCGHHHSLMLKSAETGDQLYCELCDLRDQRNDLEIELEAIQRVAEQYQDEAGTLAHELAQARAECERFRVDAERYRWARDQRTDDGIAIIMKNKHIDDSISYQDNIDRYIDAARKEGT